MEPLHESSRPENPTCPSRRKRQYLSLDIERLLAKEGIDSNELMPRHPDPQNPQTIEQGHDPLFPIYLPLKVSQASVDCQWRWDGRAGPRLKLRSQTPKESPTSATNPYMSVIATEPS